MSLVKIITTLSLLSASMACGSRKDYARSTRNAFNNTSRLDAIIAWNEDTVNNYQIALLNKGRFVYAVSKPDTNHQQITSYYGGSFYVIGDSIALRFRDDNAPPGLAKYMYDEVSGNYLIQYFANGTRMFLRIQKRPKF